MSTPRPAFVDDLDATLAEAWRLIAQGVADRQAAFHHPVLATVGAGGEPQARTVVLRGCEVRQRVLRFHTDARSAKAGEVAGGARICLHFYDPVAKIQLRATGQAQLHHDDASADAAWAGSGLLSRQCYGIAPGPGTVIGAADAFSLPLPTEEAIAPGRANFLAVTVRVDRLEWLFLAIGGHRRARFDWTGDSLAACWLAP